MKRLKKLLLFIILPVILLLTGLMLFLFSASGFKLLVELTPRLVPFVRLVEVEGSWNNFTAKTVGVDLNGIHVAVNDAHISLDLRCLAQFNVCVNQLVVGDVVVAIDTAALSSGEQIEETAAVPSLQQIHLPFGIRLDKLSIKHADVKINEMQFKGDLLQAKGEWFDKISLSSVSLDKFYMHLFPTSESKEAVNVVALSDDEKRTLSSQLDEFFKLPLLNSLPTVLIPMDFDVPNFTINSFELEHSEHKLLGQNFTLSFTIDDHLITVDSLTSQLDYCPSPLLLEQLTSSNNKIESTCAQGELTLKGQLTLAKQWALQSDIELAVIDDKALAKQMGLELSETTLKTRVEGDIVGALTSKIELLQKKEQLFELDLNADLATPYLPTSVAFKTKALSWPMVPVDLSRDKNDLAQNGQRLISELESLDSKKTGTTTEGSAKLALVEEAESTDLNTIKTIQPDSYQIFATEVNLKGNANEYAVGIETEVDMPFIQRTHGRLTAKGSLDGIVIQELLLTKAESNQDNLESADKKSNITENTRATDTSELTTQLALAQLLLSAKLNWKDSFTWDASLTFDELALTDESNAIDFLSDGQLKTAGTYSDTEWKLDLPELNLSGKLNGFPLNVSAELSGNSHFVWDVKSLEAKVGENSLLITGQLKDEMDLNAKINAPKLSGILPELKGRIVGEANITGQLHSPIVQSNLEITQFKLGDVSINAIQFNSDLAYKEEVSGQLTLQGKGISLSDIELQKIDLNLKGSESSHALRLNLQGTPISAKFDLDGVFNKESVEWKAKINTVNFTTPEGNINSVAPFNLSLGTSAFTITEHCWQHKAGEVCLDQNFTWGQSSPLNVSLRRLDLNFINQYLTKDTQLQGVITGQAAILLSDLANISGSLKLIGDRIGVDQHVGESHLPIRFDNFSLNGRYDKDKLSLDWDMRLKNNGGLNGTVVISDILKSRQLSGSLRLNEFNLNLFAGLLGTNEKIKGYINSNLSLAGTTESPQLNGHMHLDRLVLFSHQVPFDITDGNLAISFNGKQSMLSGEIITNDGNVSIDGSARFDDINRWDTLVRINSNRLGIAIPPQVKITLQPDIQFEASPSLMNLTGNVTIPQGRIVVDELPQSVIDVSDDQVFLDEYMNPIEVKTGGIPLKTNIDIYLGEDIKLSAFGLNTGLIGHLNVSQNEQGMSLFGDIFTKNGNFRAYGQDLVLRKGVISFAGAADRPKLNVEAIRNPNNIRNDVVAGVRVTGFADDPRLELFSTPSMAQEEILSYILRGEGLDSRGADTSLMTSMLIGMGTSQSGRLIGQIGETFGVKNLTLDTQGSGEESQVVVSGELLPGLQVRYGVGVFDALATITLRYQLLPRLYLEAVSGMDQAIDLLYQFEFD